MCIRDRAGPVGLAVQPLKMCGIILALPKGVVGKIQAVQLFRKMAERVVDLSLIHISPAGGGIFDVSG